MGSLYSPSSPDFRKALATLYHCLLFLDTVSLQLPSAGFYFPFLLALDPCLCLCAGLALQLLFELLHHSFFVSSQQNNLEQ